MHLTKTIYFGSIMKELILIKTLEYYDVPQILVAADATGTNYLCTLYKNDAEDGYLYLGVQISGTADCCLCLVAATNGVLNIVKPLQIRDITEEMLPEAGYTCSMV